MVIAKRKREGAVELGNLICKFGDQVLLDYVEEIVLPAFMDNSLKRVYGDTTYFFHRVEVVRFSTDDDTPVLGVVGRLIKNTIIKRDQVFDEKLDDLVPDEKHLESAPSSLFVLVLNNHRLIFYKETKDAPTMTTFKATLYDFLKTKWGSYIDRLHAERKTLWKSNQFLHEKVTKKELMEDIPRPTLNLIPLTSEDSISDFVGKYSVLRKLRITFGPRNDENDNEGLFPTIQEHQEALLSEKVTLSYTSSSGLKKNEVIKEATAATKQGNQQIEMDGTDIDGDRLTGDNEHFKIARNVSEMTGNVRRDGAKIYGVFTSLLKSGTIAVDKMSAAAISKIKKLSGSMSDGVD